MTIKKTEGGSGAAMMKLVEELRPLPRSITGDGVRETLRSLRARIPIEMVEVASGTRVFDWVVPDEWTIRDAYVKDPSGRKVIDFSRSTLHVVGYSVPVKARMDLEELRPRLFSLPEHPDWIPYKTSYYSRTWGFCLSHRVLTGLPRGEYEVLIDSTLAPGHLTYGELVIPGTSEDEVLISTHVCHPWMCNDNLSGIAVACSLAERLAVGRRRLSYRFLFVPGTIGAISWLAKNEDRLHRIKHGLVLSGVGDGGGLTYKMSRIGNAPIDRAASAVLGRSGAHNRVRSFEPFGYDERQYCSPGLNLPVGCLMRTPWGEYPQYHTSGDDLSFIRGPSLEGTVDACREIFELLEERETFVRTDPRGEPQLSRHGVFGQPGRHSMTATLDKAILWVLNLSDGRHTLLEMSERSGVDAEALRAAVEILEAKALISRHGPTFSSG